MTNFCSFDGSTAKVRRLYDIANVLSSMNLIEKVNKALTKSVRGYITSSALISAAFVLFSAQW